MNAPNKSHRRVLRFESVNELAAEVERIVAAHCAGQLAPLGDWTPAQIFDHLAKFIEFSYEGFPFRASWPLWTVSHLAKWIAWERFVDWSLRPGYRIPAYADALQPDPWADFDVATTRLHTALLRIRRGQPMLQPSPFEGEITHEQWVYVHLRHAELHLSFLDLRAR